MDDALLALVLARLDADASLETDTQLLVLAACEGDDELADALGGAARRHPQVTSHADAAEPAGAYVCGLTVEGFRGIGPACTIALTPGPGLTLVVGRNGSGKSSFVEALEVLLTGDSRRWAGRPKAWKDGWRNLHHAQSNIAAEFVVEGEPGVARIACEWDAGADVDAGTVEVQAPRRPKTSLDSLGWSEALVTYRPFLSYNELGSILDEGPSKLYDALFAILGLDELAAAQKRLALCRKTLKDVVERAKGQRTMLLSRLDTVHDERATRSHQALSGRNWDLNAVRSAVAGTGGAEPGGAIDTLRRLAAIDGPVPDAVEAAVGAARAAASFADRVAGTEGERALRVAELLEQALEHHHDLGDGPCPVCGAGALDAGWREHAERERARLLEAASDARRAVSAVDAAWKQLRGLVTEVPEALVLAPDVGVDSTATLATWRELRALPGALEAAANHFESRVAVIAEELQTLRDRAHRALEAREADWIPLATALAAWLEIADRALAAEPQLKAVTAGEKWLKGAADEVRNERLAPLRGRAAHTWSITRIQPRATIRTA